MHTLLPAAALLLALQIDRWWGEPPARLHPVVWMGQYLGWAGRHLQRISQPEGTMDYKVFWLAAFYWSWGVAMFSGAIWGLQTAIEALGFWGAAVLLALLLKPLLAWAMLKHEVQAVELALGQSLDAGRTRLGWLVSREVAALSETQVRESAIESLAENLSDSVIAPIFWFVLLGLPGAALYRFANTADAMWGYKGVYKGANWEWAGKWAARADDVLSWLPARLTGGVLALLYRVPLHRLRAQAGLTPSPNSGWPMAAMALVLGIRLGKPGVYVLNPAGRAPDQRDTDCAIVYAEKTVLALVFLWLIALVLRAVVWP
jgi:adenosylcobinamide-phosphate synthase